MAHSSRIDAVEKEVILDAAGRLRRTLCRQMRHIVIGGELHREARQLLEAIDSPAERLTGKRDCFWDAAPRA